MKHVMAVIIGCNLVVSAFVVADSYAWSGCTIEQRIELGNQGYGKDEVEKACSQSGNSNRFGWRRRVGMMTAIFGRVRSGMRSSRAWKPETGMSRSNNTQSTKKKVGIASRQNRGVYATWVSCNALNFCLTRLQTRGRTADHLCNRTRKLGLKRLEAGMF